MPRRRTYGTGSLRKVGRIWWMRVRSVGGKRIEESTGCTERAEALLVMKRRRGELSSAPMPTASRATVGDLCQLVLADYEMRQRRDAKHARWRYEANIAPALGTVKTGELSPAGIRTYVADRRAAGASPATINREFAMIKRGFTLGQKEDPPLCGPPPAMPRLEEGDARQGFLEREAYLRLRSHLRGSLAALFVVAYHVATRKGELLKLKWIQVDFASKRITFLGSTTKSKADRKVPIYGDMYACLQVHRAGRPAGNPYVFYGAPCGKNSGKPCAIDPHLDGWDEACTAAGVPGLLFHDLRRTAVRNMRLAGMSESDAMKISGHKTRAVFERYNISDEKDLDRAAAKLEAYLDGHLVKPSRIGEKIGGNGDE